MLRQFGCCAIAGGVFAICSFANAGPTFTIDFETEDDFATPLIHGQAVYSTPRVDITNPTVPYALDTVLEFGNLFNARSTVIGSDGHLGPAIFDSDPDDTPPGSSPDDDLLVGLGNVLILQEDAAPGNRLDLNRGLVFRNPDDEANEVDRGSIVFDFLVPRVHPISIDLVDVDQDVHMEVILTDAGGLQRTYSVPTAWTTDIRFAGDGYQTLNLDVLLNQPADVNATGGDATATQDPGFDDLRVIRLEVQMLGLRPSGAIDNLVFSVPEPGTLLYAALMGALAWSGLRCTRKLLG